MPNKLLFGGWAAVVDAKTASYTVKARDCGKLFTNRGATGTITFTLPKIDALTGLKGVQFEFATVAAQSIVIASDPSDKLIVHADGAADSVTTAATIGQHLRVVSDGTAWIVISDPSAASAATAVTAVTIAT